MISAGNIVGGKYRLLSRVGEGSMGAVWKAVHETLDRPFAVKFLKDYEASSPRPGQRFLAEARLAASVRSRYVVDVVDYGLSDDDMPYMVMEYLSGLSLADRLLQPRPLGVGELLRMVCQALAGLEAVHRAGILHRDLKPENIVLCPEGDRIVAKLIDFGISRSLYETPTAAREANPDQAPRAAIANRLTMPGTTLGTPWYMAPEQAQALPLDARSDVYAAGVIVYEALTGRLPFEHDDANFVLMMVAAGGAAPVSVYRPDLPPALSDVVERAMALHPRARPPSAADFASALRAVARELPPKLRCRRRGEVTVVIAPQPQPAPPPEIDFATPTPEPRPVAHMPPLATLPRALARVGFARMPSRRLLAGAGAGMAAALVGLAVVAELLADPPASAQASRPAGAPRVTMPHAGASPAHARPGSRGSSSEATLANTAAPTTPVRPRAPTRTGRRTPEIFRSPGF